MTCHPLLSLTPELKFLQSASMFVKELENIKNRINVSTTYAIWEPKISCKAGRTYQQYRTLLSTTRSGYVISCNEIGPDHNQNIDLTAKGLSSTEMSKQRALWLGCSLKKSNSM